MVQVFLEVHGDPGVVHEVRGAILLRSPVLAEDDRNLHSPLVRIDQGFRDRRGSEGVCLDEDLLLGIVQLTNNGLHCPPIGEKKISTEGVPSRLAEI